MGQNDATVRHLFDAPISVKNMAVLQIANGEKGAEASPASASCGDAVNLVDEPDLPDNIALG